MTVFEFAKAVFDNNMTITAGLYPAVPFFNAGIRVQLTLYQDKSDIDRLLNVMKATYEYQEKNKDFSIENVLKRFKD